MNTVTSLAAVAVTSGFAGLLCGALLWQKYIGRPTTTTPCEQQLSHVVFWDIHSVLNAMNRFAVAAERGRAVDPAPVYNLSDYLLHSAMLQRKGGCVNSESLQKWLLAHVRIHSDLHANEHAPEISVRMPKDMFRVQVGQIIRELLWLLQRAQTVDRIEISLVAISKTTVNVRIHVYGTLEKLRQTAAEDFNSLWRLEAGSCYCELSAPYNLSP